MKRNILWLVVAVLALFILTLLAYIIVLISEQPMSELIMLAQKAPFSNTFVYIDCINCDVSNLFDATECNTLLEKQKSNPKLIAAAELAKVNLNSPSKIEKKTHLNYSVSTGTSQTIVRCIYWA